ncbi:hypothetical protein PTKIN_Ptkin14bG0122800 [Pterospermum kingtungense]
MFDEEARMKFAHFVYRVLLLNKADSVKKFRLNCNENYGQFCINTWICSAIERGLQEVDICISEEAEEEDIVKLPSDLFLTKTLKVLKLRGGIMFDVPSSVSLPSLKILHLLRVNYANGESILSFISGCLSLEELSIDIRIRPQTMVNFNISIPTLKSLSLTLYYDFHDRPHEEEVEINASALEYLHYSSSGFTPKQYYVENFPCMIEADISFPDCHKTQLFRALNRVKFLRLVWHRNFWRPARNSFPFFVNLNELELHGAINWLVVSLFLQNSPKLETLLVHDKMFVRNGGCKWTQPRPVPTCFLSSLSMVCYKDFEGLDDELKMVEYFLKKARVLRTMEIYTINLSSDSKRCFLKKLSMFQKSSKTCQLSLN